MTGSIPQTADLIKARYGRLLNPLSARRDPAVVAAFDAARARLFSTSNEAAPDPQLTFDSEARA